MKREQYHTRLSPDRAERVDEYADEHGITTAEAVRRLIVAGLEAEAESEPESGGAGGDATDPETERATRLARFGERLFKAGIVLLLATAVPPSLLAVAVETGVFVGAVGATVTSAATLLLAVMGILATGVGVSFITEAVIRYHVQSGPVGRRLTSLTGGLTTD